MKKSIDAYSLLLSIVIAAICGLLTSCAPASDKDSSVIYTCPMHPEIRQSSPGNCPICKMKLVPAEEHKDTINVDRLLDATDSYVVSGVEAIKPFTKAFRPSVTVQGVIAYNERLWNSVAARVDGRIEQLYVKYSYQPIQVGQRLFDLYSPELLNEQQNFIFLIRNESQESTIVEAARMKLKLLGLTESQIRSLETTKQLINPVPYFSPYAGHLHTASESPLADDMQTMPSEPAASNTSLIKEGMYIKKGQVIFQINSTAQVWGMLNVALNEASLLKTGDSVEIRSKEGAIPGRIDFIEPALRNGQNFISVRVNLENPDEKLKIGENISAVLRPAPRSKLLLPASAVVSLGIRNVVFVKEGNRYKAREIQTGSRSGELIEVVSGLDSTAMVAKSAAFLIDSESFVNPND